MSDRLLKESDVLRIAFQLPLVVNSAFADAVKALPNADRPQCEWIETPDGTMCGNCHKFPYDDGEYHIANWSSDFCPHCGVRMKGTNNGEDIQSTDE